MTKPFAVSAFPAYASFTVSDTQRSDFYFSDGPRGSAAMPRWFEDLEVSTGIRGQLLGSAGSASQTFASTFALSTPEPVSTAFGAAATSDSLTLMRCGCASCMSAAQTQAEKAAYSDAAWAAYESGDTSAFAIDPGETAMLDDVADDSSTTTVLDAQEGDSFHSQIDHPLDADWFVVELTDSNSYKFTLTPDDASGDPGSPDLLIEIYDSAGVLIESYDSGSFGASETATFTPSADGAYYVAVKGWTPADVGGYTITAQINDSGPTTGTPLASINWGGDDNVVATGNYDAQGRMIIKVYFSQTGDAPYGSPDDPVVGLTWDSWAKDGCFAAFACYENVINVVFEEVFTQEEADFILAATASAPVILGRMRPPGEPNAGLGEFNVLASTWTEEGTAQGGYMWITFIHELGHGMGLAHPHDTGGGSEVMHGVSGSLATGYSYGDFDLNQGVFTTMSYNDGWQTAPHGNSDSDAYGYQGTLMALDIAMLQIKYGANTTYNNTDTVYALPTTNEAGTFYACIWDTGGADWLIAGAGIDCVIDLRPATLQYEYGGGGFVSYAANIHGGFTIANGVVIENAIGGAGEDVITGNTAANWLMGDLGADTISGGDGDDRIEGGEGDDTLNGDAGTDTLDYNSATAGITLNMGVTTAQATGGAGTDTIAGFENFLGSDFADNITGTTGVNNLQGNDGNDTLNGHDGDDTLDGGDGNDVLEGGAGVDTTTGGAGDDWHYVDNAADIVVETFGGGSDRVLSTVNYTLAAGVDVEMLTTSLASGSTAINLIGNELGQSIEGNEGANTLDGQDGADNISGYGGTDNLIGGGGIDTLNGGDGNDTVTGGTGNDSLDGGTGHDTFNFAAGDGVDTITGFAAGGTDDTIVVTGFASYTLSQEGANLRVVFDASNSILLNNVLAANFTAADINIPLAGGGGGATTGDDVLTGTAGADSIDGLAGNDVISGLGGNDTLLGNDGNDVLKGGDGNDVLNGGNGTDTVDYSDAAAGVIVNFGSGKLQNTVGAGIDTMTNVENLTGSAFNDTLTGNSSANVISGGAGADTVNAGSGNDTVNGGAGNDTLNGAGGADIIAGGLGDDAINGGTGHDIFNFAAGDGVDTITGFTAGGIEDTIFVTGYTSYTKVQEGADLRIVFDASNSILLLGVSAASFTAADINIPLGGGGGNVINGTAGGDRITGTANADTINGLDGDDTLTGAGGDDILNGGNGADTLRGVLGNDLLNGGAGNDTLTGGDGLDTFQFNALFGADRISDFQNGTDKIQFSGIAGVDDFSDLAISTNGSGWAVITLPDGSTITLTGMTASQMDPADFAFGP